MIHPFNKRLESGGPVLTDGAMGTQLYERLGYRYVCFEELNTESPQTVQSVHRDYIEAGAELIETNTFGCNRFVLSMHGLERDVQRLARAGARIAREAQESLGADIFVAGAVGPLNRALGVSEAEMRDAFREEIDGLLWGGVDLFILETFGSLDEILIALSVCRECSQLPIVASMTYAEDGETLGGERPEHVASALQAAGADVVGANCGFGPQPTLAVIEHLRSPDGPWLSAMPNAGLPARVEGRLVYTTTPTYFADYARRLSGMGVRVIGGCCGTTPAHIAVMHDALGLDQPSIPTAGAAPAAVRVGPASIRARPVEEEPVGVETATQLTRDLSSGKFIVSVEMKPPRGANPNKVLRAGRRLKEAGVTAVDVTDSAMARVRMNPLCTAHLLQSYVGIEVIAHLTTRDRNLMALQADLLGAHALGLRSILALTGDPPNTSSWAPATGVYDLDSIGLITLIKRLNEGQDAAGTSIGAPTRFFVACSLNPMAPDLDLELDRLARKIDAGADLVITQPIYDVELFLSVRERIDQSGTPVLLGLLPLQSFKHAEFIHNELAGVSLPPSVLERMRLAGSDGISAGLDLAWETLQALHHTVQGVYIMPSFDRYEPAAALVERVQTELPGYRETAWSSPGRTHPDMARV